MEDDNYDELFYTIEEERAKKPKLVSKMILPAVVEDYAIAAEKISYYNEVPAAISFFVILGQISKDLVAIPNRGKTDDTRLQFLWMQTSGTGKSTLNNWYIPLVTSAFEKINTKYHTNFDIFDTTDYTDAALIGSMDKEDQQVEDENGNVARISVDVILPGQLEGNGLAIWDEFENSGVFKQSQHKENAVVYLNTFMNTLWGETWRIKKKLRLGTEPIICECRRSVFGCTYIPVNLNRVIAEKGVLQRLLIYIREVPQNIQENIRVSLTEDWGIIEDTFAPTEKFSQNFVKLYDCLKERFDEVDGDPKKTVIVTKEAREALTRECHLMENYINDARPEVVGTMNTFINRTLMHMQKLAVLCCIAEAPSIIDKTKRYRVSAGNVIQAASLIRQCYKSLVDWLDEALIGRKLILQDKANLSSFKKVYRKLALNRADGWVNKNTLWEHMRKETGRRDGMIYKWWKMSVKEYFESQKDGTAVYIRLKEDIR
tara:strand:+ start:446 stop:1906 length:1461 start_codon:yes stop_codon:yes gene_type:complete